MQIINISLSYHRLYSHVSFMFNKKVWLSGNNGTGKTSVLEALALLQGNNYFLYPNIKTLLNIKNPLGWQIEANLNLDNIIYNLKININKNRRNFMVDGKNTQQKFKKFNILSLTPHFDSIINDDKENNREFFNNLINQIQGNYMALLNKYYYFYNQRKEILKQIYMQKNYRCTLHWLDELENKIATCALEIINIRLQFLTHINKILLNNFINLNLSLTLEIVGLNSPISLQEYTHNLKINRKEDAIQCQFGIQRCYWQIFYHHKQVYNWLCSTGEQKILIIACILSVANMQFNLLKQWPILLLDDINSHLSATWQNKFNNFFMDYEGQVFVTSNFYNSNNNWQNLVLDNFNNT